MSRAFLVKNLQISLRYFLFKERAKTMINLIDHYDVYYQLILYYLAYLVEMLKNL